MTINWRALLSKIPTTVYLVAGAVALFASWLAINNQNQRAIGKRDIQIHQYEVANAALRHEADSLAKVYRVDTLRLTRLKLRTDTLTQTVERWKHDTLEVVRYVVQADSTIKACGKALSVCEARAGVAERGWAGARDEIRVLKAQMPGRGQRWQDRAVGLAAGLIVGYVAKP